MDDPDDGGSASTTKTLHLVNTVPTADIFRINPSSISPGKVFYCVTSIAGRHIGIVLAIVVIVSASSVASSSSSDFQAKIAPKLLIIFP